jgi:TolC family type I secretion outer membrane protein
MKRLPPKRLRSVIGAAALCGMGWAAQAGTPPDPFRTDSALHKDAPGLSDPFGRDCVVPGGPLTFASAVNLALCRNPQTRAAWAQAHAQAAALGSAESAWLPTVTLSGGESRDFGQHVDVTGNLVNSAQNSGDATVNLAWTLFDFGGRSSRIRSAHSLLDAAAATASSVAQQTVRTVVQAYYGVVAGDAALGAAKTTDEVTAHSLEIARALREGGVGTLADVLQAETAHGQAKLSRIQAEADAKNARGTLAVTLGLSADQALQLDAEPVPTELPPLTARMADLMAEAARQRPDLKAAQAQRDAAEANITTARALGRPVIALGALHDFTSTSGVPNENYNQIGLTVNWPLFTGFNTSYGVRQAQATLQQQEANLEQVGLSVTLDVWNGYYALDSANQQLLETASLIKTAEDNLQVAFGRYQAGVGTIVDVLTAQTAAATSRTLRINAELGWKVARANLALALGRLSSADPLAAGAALP